MPGRVLQGSIVTSESLAACSEGAALTFVHLMLTADDYGRLDGRLQLLHGQICSLRSGVALKKLEQRLDELQNEGAIVIFITSGRPYIQITHWERDRWAGRRAKRSKFPCPRGEFGPFEPSEDILGPSRKDILGNPRSGRGEKGEGRGEKGEGGGASAPGPAGPSSFPDPFPVQHLDALMEWWYSQNSAPPGRCFAHNRDPMDVLRAEVDHAVETVRIWATSNGKRKKDWYATVQGAMRDGWGLKGLNGAGATVAQSPVEARAERTRQAARDVMGGS